MAHQIHIVGAGVAGLSAAAELSGAGQAVVVHEGASNAGGRCRSYHDPALNMVIDNGNHLVLSGNRAVMRYLDAIGSRAALHGPDEAAFAFVDLADNARWTLRLGEGRLPWWMFDRRSRAPDTAVLDYLPMAKLLWASSTATVGDVLACKGPAYDRFLQPLLLAALNIDPRLGSAKLAASVLRETISLGGQACHPLIAHGLSEAFIEPAINFIRQHGGTVRLGHRLRSIGFDGDRAASLDFGDDGIVLGTGDAVVLAVPPMVAMSLVPGITVPDAFCGIVNAHFAFQHPSQTPAMIGAVNGTVEWLFVFPDRLSVTISGANHLMDVDRDELAQKIWYDVTRILNISAPLPPWQIVRERRATFAATPVQDAMRPKSETSWSNLVLAGDWTATGLPATIEGAVRSGVRAAQLVRRQR